MNLSFNTEKYRKAMSYIGSVSGRDEDKIEKVGFTVEHENGIPYFKEAETVILCKKLSKHFISPEAFLDEKIDTQWYGDKDYHDMYIGEIIQILEK
jgi:flavin reductase (DIM6/NTAB) family NADH-FMN oxidoreductase RutF